MSKKKERRNCLKCGLLLDRPEKFYCNNVCQQEFFYDTFINEWRAGLNSGTHKYGTSRYIRKYLMRKFENKCEQCGWGEINPTTGKTPLNVEHIDGNWENNSESNLKLLCPNCHSLTSTFGSLNNGKGRKFRYL